MRINQAGINLIKKYEGLSLQSYLCPANVFTIGWGNTYYENGKKVQEGETITEERAEELLMFVIRGIEINVENILQNNHAPQLNSNQFSALISFVYNIGEGAFKKSTLLKKIVAGDFEAAANQFPRWNRAGGRVLAGLTKRRKDERNLFLS